MHQNVDMQIQEQGTLPSSQEVDFIDLRKQHGGQVRNDCGCYMNEVDDMRRLERFIVLGMLNGCYRPAEDSLKRENLQFLDRLIAEGKGKDATELIEKISIERRNLKQKPLLFALAMCARSDDRVTKRAAYSSFLGVCRIPTCLFLFIKYCEELSAPGTGWGRAHKTAIQNWYLQFGDDPEKLLQLVTKYKKREDWTHKDVLRLAHPKPPENALGFVLRYITHGLKEAVTKYITNGSNDDISQIQTIRKKIESYEDALRNNNEEELAYMIDEFDLTWEHIPTSMLNSSTVWLALLKDMPKEAFLRNLGRMTRLGMFAENSEEEKLAVDKIKDMNTPSASEQVEEDDADENFTPGRETILHPFRIFVAWKRYNSRGSLQRDLCWCPNQNIVRVMENAFYAAFSSIEAVDKKCLIAIDVSAFMSQPVLGLRDVSCSMVAAAMMMTFIRTVNNEENIIVGTFSDEFRQLQIGVSDTLEEEVMRKITNEQGIILGNTDCSVPMKWAIENRVNDIDTFIIFSPNRNNSGNVQPAEALRQYRQSVQNNNVKLIVCAMCDNSYSAADQNDPGMLDIAGFDLALPHIITEFIKED